MFKKSTPFWRKAHFKVKSVKNWRSRSTLGSLHVEKVHAVVAGSPFRIQNVTSNKCLDHFWTFRCRFGFCSSFNYNRHYTPRHYNDNYKYTTLHCTTLHSATPQMQLQLHYYTNYMTLHYTPLHSTPLRYTTLNHTTPHYATPHHTTTHYTDYNYNYDCAALRYTTLNYTTLPYTTLHYAHYTTTNATATNYTNYTTPQLQLHYPKTTTTAALHHTTSSSCGWGDRPGDHCNHCNHCKKYNSNHVSVHQWLCSAIRGSQQQSSPIGFLFWNFRHRLVRYFWYICLNLLSMCLSICMYMYTTVNIPMLGFAHLRSRYDSICGTVQGPCPCQRCTALRSWVLYRHCLRHAENDAEKGWAMMGKWWEKHHLDMNQKQTKSNMQILSLLLYTYGILESRIKCDVHLMKRISKQKTYGTKFDCELTRALWSGKVPKGCWLITCFCHRLKNMNPTFHHCRLSPAHVCMEELEAKASFHFYNRAGMCLQIDLSSRLQKERTAKGLAAKWKQMQKVFY